MTTCRKPSASHANPKESDSPERTSAKSPLASSGRLQNMLRLLFKKPRLRTWRVKQANDNPCTWVLGDCSDIKMSIVFLNHFRLISLPKFRFPFISIVSLPFTEGLAHLPITAKQFMPRTCIVVTPKLVSEIERYFLKFRWRPPLKHVFLPQYR
jgi:hypothetical protein